MGKIDMNFLVIHVKASSDKSEPRITESSVECTLVLSVDHAIWVRLDNRDRDRNEVHLSWGFSNKFAWESKVERASVICG